MFIPVIGSVIGDASRTVNASIATVKSTVGYIGVAALAILLLPPIITAILYKFVVLLAAMAARILGCDRESKLLYDISSLLSVLMATIIGVSAVFLISVAHLHQDRGERVMRTFFLSVFLASLAGALSVAFAGGGAYEKYIKYIVSLLLILLLISPFASLKSIDYELEAPGNAFHCRKRRRSI